MTTLPDDAGDLFAVLYDRLGDRPFADGRAESWALDAALTRRSDEIELRILQEGSATSVSGGGVSGDVDAFVALRGIDAALEHMSPFTGAAVLHAGELIPIASRYSKTGVVSSAAVDGAVLFRCAFPGRPVGIGDRADFFGLVRVPRDAWARVNFQRIREPLDLGQALAASTMRAGCAPVLDSYDDIDIERTSRGLRRAYRLTPRDSNVLPRVAPILDALEAERVTVGVMPEASVSPTIREEWLAEMRRRSPNLEHLSWVLIGTGPDGSADPPYNRAVLAHRSGTVLIEQDKLHDFTLTRAQLRDWQLGAALGTTLPRVEDITRGTRVELRESTCGRIAILICEDLTRGDVCDVIRACGVSHVFVPIFSPEAESSWADFASERQVQEVGAWVLVATSLAVPRARKPSKTSWCTCLVVGPKDDRDEWEVNRQPGNASQATDVAVLSLRSGRASRFDDF